VDADKPEVEIIHRGQFKSLTKQQRGWLKRRQAIEPAIGRFKSENRLDRCPLQGPLGDARHAVLCAAGYNIRWLMQARVRLGLKALLLRPHRPHAAQRSTPDIATPLGRNDWQRQMNFAGTTN
jgi:IS5 family transposase